MTRIGGVFPCSGGMSQWRGTMRSRLPIRRSSKRGKAPGPRSTFFSPLADEAPHPAADAVYLPGGYPELHAGRIAAAATFLSGLLRPRRNRQADLRRMRRLHGIGRGADRRGGVRAPDGRVAAAPQSFAERRLHLGYREAAVLGETPLGKRGARFRGHEFHYATVVSESAPNRCSAYRMRLAPISADTACAAARCSAPSST